MIRDLLIKQKIKQVYKIKVIKSILNFFEVRKT